jgi:methyltransferase (TIGR00027 family)
VRLYYWSVAIGSISRTATGAAFCRLVEQSQPAETRLFNDPVVMRLLDPMAVAMASPGPMRDEQLASLGSGTYGSLVMRTRFIDDVVTAQVAGGVTQVVILGAGLDTRAYRLPALREATVFEVDLPRLQRRKRKALRKIASTAREVRFVPMDLTTQRLDEALPYAGLDTSQPALFVWEGVTQYLPESAVRSTLAFVGRACAGTSLVFTYVRRSVVNEGGYSGWSRSLRVEVSTSEPWIFGLEPDDVPGLLDESGMRLVQDVGADDYQSLYLRPLGRQLDIDPGERVAVALV